MIQNLNKSVFLFTNGCPENRIDMARIREFFIKNGWKISDSYLNADLILFNACALTEFDENRSVSTIQTIRTFKPDHADFIVCGCLPKINPLLLGKHHDGIVLYGEHDVDKLNTLIGATFPVEEAVANDLEPCGNLKRKPSNSRIYSTLLDQLFVEKSKSRSKAGQILTAPLLYYDKWLSSSVNIFHRHQPTYYIKVCTGCLNHCAYCAVKKSRGNLSSVPPEKIIAQLKSGLSRGFKQFSLLGTDIGPYGRDIGTNVVELLSELTRIEGDFSLRIRNIEPLWLTKFYPEIEKLLASNKISFIGIPIESGNDEILAAMRRGYKIGPVKDTIRQINQKFPAIFIRTQLMTGFPGETRVQYVDTCRLVDELNFDYVEVYAFSARPDTPAMTMTNQIPPAENSRRRNKLWLKALLRRTPQKLLKILKYSNYRVS
ncbi:radical SAM protein [candidate division KSB1 bacterium]|nr:radical SAM protein [candidate division KSB1 bacterium]